MMVEDTVIDTFMTGIARNPTARRRSIRHLATQGGCAVRRCGWRSMVYSFDPGEGTSLSLGTFMIVGRIAYPPHLPCLICSSAIGSRVHAR